MVNDIILVNEYGFKIKSMDELLEYVMSYLDYSIEDFEDNMDAVIELLQEEDLVGEDFELSSLRDGYKVLKNMEPGLWHIER